MKLLKDILYKVPIQSVHGVRDMFVNSITSDSRMIKQNDAFIALKGVNSDGHKYIFQALNNGAKVVVCENLPKVIQEGVTFIEVSDSHISYAHMATNFFDNPSKKLKLVGVTGTNGKTTVSTLLYKVFNQMGYKVGLFSTVKIIVDTEMFTATHTTPDALVINEYLQKMVDKDVTHCFMEVSSHSIAQKRIAGLVFEGGVFTNLTHDHLDYHKTFIEYRDVKKSFFDKLPSSSFSLINIDDNNGKVMIQNTCSKIGTYAIKSDSNYKAKVLENNFTGLYLRLDGVDLYSKLIGKFNAYNLLAVYGTSMLLGTCPEETLRQLSQLDSVTGRFQYMMSKDKISVIVDYAHTPDALKNVLKTINEIRTRNEQLITVFGCGGNRDKLKRPIMGDIAAEMSDKLIITSDNPRTENPETIIKNIEDGVPALHFKKTLSIVDRQQAIKAAVQMAQPNDIILIAGKGHETYQEINGERIHFDDFEQVKKLLVD